MDSITATEYEQINQLRTKLTDIEINQERFGNGEDLLVRWLRANQQVKLHRKDLLYLFFLEKKHNVNEAADAIRKYMKYRKTEGLDTIETWTLSEPIKDDAQYAFCGYDDTGCPVYFIPWARWDLKKMVDLGLGKECYMRLSQICDLGERQLMEQSNTLNKMLPGFVFLIDLSEFSFRKICSKTAIQIIIDQALMVDRMYSHLIKYCGCVNVPKAWTYLWKIIQPFIRQSFRHKIEFHASVTNNLKERFVQNNIPAKCIPTIFEGSYELQISYYTNSKADNKSDKMNDEDSNEDILENEDDTIEELQQGANKVYKTK